MLTGEKYKLLKLEKRTMISDVVIDGIKHSDSLRELGHNENDGFQPFSFGQILKVSF